MSNIIKFAAIQKSPFIICSKPPVPDEIPEIAEKEEPEVDTVLSEAARMSEELLGQARKEADTIIAAAKTDAAQCLAEANLQAEQLKQQAYESGQQTGHQEGLSQGKQDVLEEMRQAVDKSVEKAQNILTAAEQEAQKMILAAERQIIDIALAVARKVLAREIEENPMTVLPIVKAALEKVRDQDNITIRVNPEDFDMVLYAKRDLQIMLGGERSLAINADHTINQGGCMIDTAYGTVDARLDFQFEMLKKVLQEVLP